MSVSSVVFGLVFLCRVLVHLSRGVSTLIRVIYIKLFYGVGGIGSFLRYMIGLGIKGQCVTSVSYTHLTLPTKRIV